MIAHNVVIGESSILVAQTGIARQRRARPRRGARREGRASTATLRSATAFRSPGTSGVVKSLPAGAIALGTPAESQREFMARHTLPSRFEKLQKKFEALKAEVEALKGSAR